MAMNYARAHRADPGALQARRIASAAPERSHSEGWPHLDKRGNCLCVKRCCLGPAGCACEVCEHKSHPWARSELATA